MNANSLLAQFDRIGDAPEAIPRLRRFILDLAVSGRLVRQHQSDEPATELLKGIAAEKAQLVKTGEIKKIEPILDLTDSVPELRVPQGWVITTLQSICASVTDGDHLPPPRAENGVPFLVIGNIRSKKIDFEGSRLVPTAYYESLDGIRRPRSGDLLYTLVGSYGIPVIVPDDRPFCVQRHIGILRPSAFIEVEYLALAMGSRLVFDQATECATGIAQKTVPLSGLRRLLIPLPPHAEQSRIIAKANELMALCDRLEASRSEREATRGRLTAAALSRLNAFDPKAFGDDARFVLGGLPALTARSDQVKQLRQTIINLAVRGKVAPQDPNDEPSKLSARACDPRPNEIPYSWCYTRLRNLLSEDTRNGYARRPDQAPNGTPILRISAGTIGGDGIVVEEEHKLISGISSEDRIRYGLKAGDLLACRFNGNKAFVGRLTIFNDYLGIRPIYPDKLIRVRVAPELVLATYLRIAGDTDIVRNQVEAVCATTVGNWGVSATNLKEIRFPIPPIAEQHRIVAKVDELLTLCDRLEASLVTGEDVRSRLLDALLIEALTVSERPVRATKVAALG